MPAEREALLAARLLERAAEAGADEEVGPQAAAASFRGPAPHAVPPLEESKGRLLLRRGSAGAAERLEVAETLLAALLPRRKRRKAA